MTKHEFFKLAEKYVSKSGTEEEYKAFEAYFNLLDADESPLGSWSLTKLEASKLRMIHVINNRTNHEDQSIIAHQKGKAFRSIWMVAASIALLVVSCWLYVNETSQEYVSKLITKTTTEHQRTTVTLPDGTRVRLNIGSSLSYPEQFSAHSREVSLTGEAYFEVTSDAHRPFTITTNEIKTTVLGTTFNLRSYPNESIDVTVTEGSVQVTNIGSSHRNRVSVFLVAGEQAVFERSSETLQKHKVEVLAYTSWFASEFRFDMASFEEVVQSLARWYHKEIIINNVTQSDCLVKANFENNGLEPILSRLQSIVSFQYEVTEEGKYLIKNNGCIN